MTNFSTILEVFSLFFHTMLTFSYIAKFYIIDSIYKNTLVITDEVLPLIMDSPIITSIHHLILIVSPTGSPSVTDYALLSDTQLLLDCATIPSLSTPSYLGVELTLPWKLLFL